MGFINFLKRLGRSKIQHSSEGNTTEKVRTTSEYMKALAFNNAFANLLAQDKLLLVVIIKRSSKPMIKLSNSSRL